MATSQAPTQICQKCGCEELVTQLRKVLVDVGWKMSQFYGIAPCQMCTRCGNVTVTLNAVIGDLVDLIPDPDAAPKPKKAKGAKKVKGKPKGTKPKGRTKK